MSQPRRHCWLVLGIALAALTASADAKEKGSHPHWLGCHGSRLYAEGEAWFVTRDNSASDQPVVIDTGLVPPNDVLIRVSDLDFNYDPAYRFLVGYDINECWDFEVAYLGINEANASAFAMNTNSLAIPGDLGLVSLDFFNAAQFRVDYSSQLDSLEANLIREFCRVNVLGGFRYFNWDEEFNIHPGDPDTGMSDYNIKTRNRLYGAQIGLEIDRQVPCRRWGWDASAKAGLYANDARQSQFVVDFPPMGAGFVLRDPATGQPVTTSSTTAAFVGELGIAGTYELTDHLTLRAGYRLLWVEGIALAPNQLDFTFTPTSGTNLSTAGGVFLHGATVGLEGRF